MDSREDLKPTLCVLLSRLDQAERIDPKAFPVVRPETHLERIPDKDEVTSSILVSPTGTPASAGVLLFSCRGFRCVATETSLFWLLVCYAVSNISEDTDGLWFGSRESVASAVTPDLGWGRVSSYDLVTT